MIQYIKSKRFDLAIPMAEDDPYVMHEMLSNESKKESFIDLENEVQQVLFKLIDIYQGEIEKIEMAKLQFEQQMAMMGAEAKAGGTEEEGG
jgi:glutathionylspermidine synthase